MGAESDIHYRLDVESTDKECGSFAHQDTFILLHIQDFLPLDLSIGRTPNQWRVFEMLIRNYYGCIPLHADNAINGDGRNLLMYIILVGIILNDEHWISFVHTHYQILLPLYTPCQIPPASFIYSLSNPAFIIILLIMNWQQCTLLLAYKRDSFYSVLIIISSFFFRTLYSLPALAFYFQTCHLEASLRNFS